MTWNTSSSEIVKGMGYFTGLDHMWEEPGYPIALSGFFLCVDNCLSSYSMSTEDLKSRTCVLLQS